MRAQPFASVLAAQQAPCVLHHHRATLNDADPAGSPVVASPFFRRGVVVRLAEPERPVCKLFAV